MGDEKGITQSSNLGKLYERITDNLIKERVTITNAQTGGHGGGGNSRTGPH